VRRYQYTAIDDANRVRALKIYARHTRANAIDFINYVVKKFPFRIRTPRTDRGHIGGDRSHRRPGCPRTSCASTSIDPVYDFVLNRKPPRAPGEPLTSLGWGLAKRYIRWEDAR
jgi:hypothetical protein